MSGILKNEANLSNMNRGGGERLSHIAVIQGKTQTPVAELHAGDLGVVAKLKDTLTGDTLGEKAAPIVYPKVKLPEPSISFAVEPKSRNDEDKLATAIHRLIEEDTLLRFSRDPQTKEFLVSGSGQQHVEVAVSNHPGQSRRPGQAQKADWRPRAVRRLQNQNGAPGPRLRLRVCERYLRRVSSAEFHSRDREGHRGSGGARLFGGLPRGGFSRDPLRRFLSRGRFLGNSVQACRVKGL